MNDWVNLIKVSSLSIDSIPLHHPAHHTSHISNLQLLFWCLFLSAFPLFVWLISWEWWPCVNLCSGSVLHFLSPTSFQILPCSPFGRSSFSNQRQPSLSPSQQRPNIPFSISKLPHQKHHDREHIRPSKLPLFSSSQTTFQTSSLSSCSCSIQHQHLHQSHLRHWKGSIHYVVGAI